MAKTNPGRFFEDYKLGDVIDHAVPRTVAEGERALYHALYLPVMRFTPRTSLPGPAGWKARPSTT